MPDLSAYAEVFALYETPEIVTTWQDDRIFAAQRIAGLNPTALSVVTPDGAGPTLATLAARFGDALNDAVLGPFFGPGATLARVVADRRLFVADYSALGEITADQNAPGWQAGQKLIAPVALFARSGDAPSVDPLAIGLGANHAYFARDARTAAGDERWTMAKIFVQSADYNFNQLVNHLAFTHLIEESICLAMHRRLAPQHPLNRLLVNHFTALLVINQIGVLTLLSKTGVISQILEGGLGGSLDLIRNQYAGWTFDSLDYPAQIQRRGLSDASTLPYYPFRDDGMLVWNLLGDYLDEYIALYYRSDDDVAHDYELAGFAGQLAGTLDGGPAARVRQLSASRLFDLYPQHVGCHVRAPIRRCRRYERAARLPRAQAADRNPVANELRARRIQLRSASRLHALPVGRLASVSNEIFWPAQR
jgi:arachidonate 15-lipoxygenase